MSLDDWKQLNLHYAGDDPQQRERHAVEHLAHLLPAAEANGHITSWWFIRKGAWRVRYRLAEPDNGADPLHRRLTTGVSGLIAWTNDIYEPETFAFGGPASMTSAHTLFHLDSRHVLAYLGGNPIDRRERSLVLGTALMRSADLDLNEQGDVWAQLAHERDGDLNGRAAPETNAWDAFVLNVRHLLLGAPRTDAISTDWLDTFRNAGFELQKLRHHGELTRGLRAVVAQHLIFHWNRIGIRAAAQAILARAAAEAIFGSGRPH
jgi:thiopeptide-type bacteriocin biosynthesis protein